MKQRESPGANRQSRKLAEDFLRRGQDRDERKQIGKACAERVPHKAHTGFRREEERVDPVAILIRQAQTRRHAIISLRYARMMESPFAFLRGSAELMAADLSGTERSGLTVQMCGDMHVSNFGVYASAEGKLVFGINDFDETFPGAWEWDIKRLAASAAVAIQYLGGNEIQMQEAVAQAVRQYRKSLRGYGKLGYLALWYQTISSEEILENLSASARQSAEKVINKARKRNHLQVLEQLTTLVDDKFQIRENPPMVVHEEVTDKGRPMKEAIGIFLQEYLASLSIDKQDLLKRYRIVDVARHVVGVGSVGTSCWIILLRGADNDDPLFLQFKQAQHSVLAPYFKSPHTYQSQGHRVVVGQRILQSSPDHFLGWGSVDQTEFYIRQLRYMKGGASIIPGTTKPSNFIEYCGLCGRGLALAHAKSGDAVAIGAYLGKSDAFDMALTEFAMRYADQNNRDYERMVRAVRDGRIPVA